MFGIDVVASGGRPPPVPYIVTQRVFIALEGGRRLLPGMEVGWQGCMVWTAFGSEREVGGRGAVECPSGWVWVGNKFMVGKGIGSVDDVFYESWN